MHFIFWKNGPFDLQSHNHKIPGFYAWCGSYGLVHCQKSKLGTTSYTVTPHPRAPRPEPSNWLLSPLRLRYPFQLQSSVCMLLSTESCRERSGRNGRIRFWSKDIKEQSAFTQEVYLSNLCFYFLFYPTLNFHHCMLTFKCTGVFQAYTCLPLVFNDNISKHTHKKIIFLQLIFKCICIWTTKPTVFKFLLCEPDE